MKRIPIIIILLLIAAGAHAQTNPSAQSLPYGEDFSSLAHTGTTYPAGLQGWQVTTTLGSTFNTAAPTADKTLTASSSASTTSGNVHNYNGKIGCLNSTSSGDLSLVLAVNTTGKSNIQVKYDIMTIRNPYDGTSNTRINEVTLQYRIGTSGTFTTLSGIEYQNNTTLATTSGSTAPQNTESKSITLPAGCDNQSVVQLRWISRQVSGAGSRPSFAVDNIFVDQSVSKTLSASATADATEAPAPGNGTFTLTFNPSTTTTTTFDYAMTGTATFGSDYTVTISSGGSPSNLSAASGTITVSSGISSIIATVAPIDDNSPEGSETVILKISNPSDQYGLGDANETVNIVDDDPELIHNIQGSGNAAIPGNNLVEAIVTGIYPGLNPGGFYIQEEDADMDGNANTAEGLFIVSSASVAVGDKVRVNGTVQENGSSPSFGQAVMFNCIVKVVSSGNTLPTSTAVNLPLSAVSDFEKYEGMLVHFPTEMTVTENFNLGRFGEIWLSQGGLVYQPTQVIDINDAVASGTTSSGTSNIAAINAMALANAVRTILLDDGTETMTTLPYVNADKTLRIGSTTNNLKGILGFGFSVYRIQPLPNAIPTFTYAPRPAVPNVGRHNLKVASFNVLNYFNGDGMGGGFPTARGAHSPNEFKRQRDKIINAIATIDADIVGLTEIENDGTDSNSAVADLVKGLNAKLGTGTYDFIRDGATIQKFGTDAIRCAIIYKPASVKPQGRVVIGSDAIFNRPPVSQTFRSLVTCSDFSYIINHFKSKSASGATGADIDQLDGQGAYNDRRRQQSIALVDFIRDSVIYLSGTDRVITMGDYNSYFEEDPLDLLRDSGLKVLSNSGEYSYLFNGQIGSLDHALVNDAMAPYISGIAKWHLNAAEPTHLSYEDTINDGSGDFVNQWGNTYSSIPYRSSDHDPVLVGLKFKNEFPHDVDIDIVPSNNTYTGGIPTNLYLGYGPQSATLEGSAKGGDDFTYTWSPSDNLSCTNCQNTLFTPTAPGKYTFTLTVTNSRGCSSTETVTFCVKDVKVPHSNNKIYVCHNGKTQEISVSAVPSHLEHHDNDFLGRCDDNTCGGSSQCGSKRSAEPEQASVKDNNIVGSIKVYPNPANESLQIAIPGGIENASIKITDMTGKVVLTRENAKGLQQFSLDETLHGLYVVEVSYGDQVFRTILTIN